MDQVYARAIELFQVLHAKNDRILIVADVHYYEKDVLKRRSANIFQRYLKSKDVLYQLQMQEIPCLYEDLEDVITSRYTLVCRVSDVRCISLLTALCNKDIGRRPRIKHDVFIINLESDTIFQLYDDRGCDVISSRKESIADLYKQYNDWILEYDKERIDRVFAD